MDAQRAPLAPEPDAPSDLDAASGGEEGRIVERGTHAALIARPGGAYRRFWELQTRGADASASGRLPSAM